MIPIDNIEIIFKRISENEEPSFRILFDLYKKELSSKAYNLTKSVPVTEEIIQDLFISLWVSRKKLDKVIDPHSYICRVLLNKVSYYLKNEVKQRLKLKAALIYSQSFSNLTEEIVDAKDCLDNIEKVLIQLPKQQKIVYKLSLQQGLSNFEIAQHLKISPHTVKIHLSKAIAFIKVRLTDTISITIMLPILGSFFQY